MIKFAQFTRMERAAVKQIVARGIAATVRHGLPRPDALEVRMDLSIVHASNPLQLVEFAIADDANFGHDFFGIRRHLDRTTGKLGGCFVPRFTIPRPVKTLPRSPS